MRRRTLIARSTLALAAAWPVAGSGCAAARGRPPEACPPGQTAACQRLSLEAQAAIDRSDYSAALDALGRWLALAPGSAEAHYRAGLAWQGLGRDAEARAAYLKALDLDRDYALALIGLAEVELRVGRAESAFQRLEAAIELDPRPAAAHLAQGRALEALGRPAPALAAYFRAVEREPNLVPALLRIAALQLGRRQPEQALARLNQVIDLAPDDPEARRQRGLAYLALGRAGEAVADLERAAQGLPGRPDVARELAQASALARDGSRR